MFEIAHAQGFPLELGRAPNKVRNAYTNKIIEALKLHPDTADPPRIKKLNGYKDLWRLRISDDYRLIYRVDHKSNLVIMLMLGNRVNIYKRLGMNLDGTPGTRIVARAEELLEPAPSEEDIGRAVADLAEAPKYGAEPAPDSELPQPLTAELLGGWGVPVQFHERLAKCHTEGELLESGVDVPPEIVERVMNGLWPSLIEEIVQQPVRVAPAPSEVEAAAGGERSLESFLLNLDDDQRAFVSRFGFGQPTGPWLLKGGPGSGKSTVALYCIHSLLRGASGGLPLGTEPLRILFTTFTNSLVNASEHLLEMLGHLEGSHTVDIKTVDSLAYGQLDAQWRNLKIAIDPVSFMRKAVQECGRKNAELGFTEDDAEFLLDEVEWVLVGQGLTAVEQYVQVDRTGRGRRLAEPQRRQAWIIYETCQRLLREAGSCLFSERLQEAECRVKPSYDYVFIDEAQDLKPVAIRFCIGLCQNPTNVFLTADTNQSIYGNGLSWSRVASELRFQGRARILRRNYRTTFEIWQAISQLAPNADDTDQDTLDADTVYRGPFPILARYKDYGNIAPRLNEFLHQALREERVAASCVAVLCPTSREMDQVVTLLDPRFNAKAMKSKDVDSRHPGVKVLTMHAAKGLQFPIVAVVGVEKDRLPFPTPLGIDPAEHYARYQRLFFVACSRAMRRLVVFAHREHPSPYIAGASDTYWEIEDI